MTANQPANNNPNNPNNNPANRDAANAFGGGKQEQRKILVSEIHKKWDKFSEDDVSAFKNNDELVNGLTSKYGLEKGQASRDVDTLMRGRQL